MSDKRELVFASGTPHGGALTSTLALAAIGEQRGVRASVVAPMTDPFESNRLWISSAVRAQRLSRPLGRVAWRLVEARLAATLREQHGDGDLLRARDVPSAVRALPQRPTHIIANSMRSLDLERLVRLAAELGIPLIWYLRETSSLKLVDRWGGRVDSILANSEPLADAAASLTGRSCVFVPSYVDAAGLDTAEAAPPIILLVNPIESHGVDLALGVAAELPHLRFALQESWPLDNDQQAALSARVAALPNVELRTRCARGQVYRDARLLLGMYVGEDLVLNRPRVALEAQHLGIPVVGVDTPGLRSVVASPELLLPPEAPLSAWVAVVERALREHTRFAADAVAAAERDPGLSADEVWRRFVVALEELK